MKTRCIIVILVTLIMGCLVSTVHAGRIEIVNTVNEWIVKDIITHVEYAKYYVNELAWHYLNAQQKENLAYMCAVHYVETGGGAERSEIYGSHSGKKLAKWGAFGFTIY